MGRRCGSCPLTSEDVVFFLCACCNHVILFMSVIGLNTLLIDLQTSFGSDRGSTASVQAICMAVTLGAGLIAGTLERKFGQRMTLLLGSFLSSAGFFAGGFADSLPVLFVSVGAVTGLGYSMINLVNVTFTLQRFSSKANFVSSAMVLASGSAMVCSPFVYRNLVEAYSWRGCLILTSAISLHSCIFSTILTSPLLRSHRKPAATKSEPVSPLSQHPCSSDVELEKAGPCPAPLGDPSHDCGDEESTVFLGDAAARESAGYTLDLVSEAVPLRSKVITEVTFQDHDLEILSDEGATPNGIASDFDTPEELVLLNDLDACRLTSGNFEPVTDLLEDTVTKDRTGKPHDLDLSPESTSLVENASRNTSAVEELGNTSKRLPPSHPEVVSGSIPAVLDTVLSGPVPDRLENSSPAETGKEKAEELQLEQEVEDTTSTTHKKLGHDLCNVITSQSETDCLEPLSSTPNSRDTTDAKSRAAEGSSGTTGGLGTLIRHAHFITNPLYIALVLSETVVLGMITSIIFLILDYARFQGWAKKDGLFLNVVFMTSNLVFRVLVMLISWNRKANSVVLMGVAGLVASVAMCLVGQVSDYTAVSCLFVGLAVGFSWYISLCPAAVMQTVGRRDFSIAQGLCFSVLGGGLIAWTRLAGVLVDTYGYRLVSLIYGLAMLFTSTLLLAVFRCRRRTSPPSPTG